jgi:hypothetical protein
MTLFLDQIGGHVLGALCAASPALFPVLLACWVTQQTADTLRRLER